ncbi:iroquois-class homeodomain protein irx-4-B-like isoform X2 [Dendronephthya gigantea]|uniref:iroquois-class homeodomain protein irx-4-B-like isoform X2 n=1 Tax=Dendronephthya gigantea TaxID=151771 RepID=UPI00106C3EE0|nr:iroquois-class homeodomain protein irx-4-B-like isoform X2 [Dendronephthya gigantea]
MSEVKRFHRKEAAKILVELRSKTYDGKLMDYRRQLLNHDNNTGQNSRDLQDRSGQASQWQWPYPNMSSVAFPPYNTIPIGYPWPPNTQYWFPNSTPYVPDGVANPFLQGQSFPGLEYQAVNFPWPMTPHQQGQSHSRRPRTQYTDEQRAILEESFIHGSKYPSPGERMQLESKTGVSKDKISVWFQNRRATEKRKKEQDGGSKESTTTDSELETEDEKQLSVCDETPGEDSEIETTHQRHQDNTSNDLKATYPLDISTNSQSDENSSNQEDATQALSRYYERTIEYTANHAYDTTSDQPNQNNLHQNLLHLENQNKPTFDIKLSCATNNPSNTSGYPQQQTHSANMDLGRHTDVKRLYSKQNISNTRNDTEILVVHRQSISKNERTDRATSRSSSNIYHSEIEDVQNLRNNPLITAQHLNGVSTNMSTMIPPPRSDGTNAKRSITTLHPRNQMTPEDVESLGLDVQSNINRNVIKQPCPDEVHDTIDSNKQYNRRIEETENDQNNIIGNINIPNLLDHKKKPSFMILSLPGGTIAVESTEQCLGEIKESQNYSNSSKHSDVKLPHTSSMLTNTPTEITMAHSEDTLGLYHGENENTMAQQVKLKTSFHNRSPRKRAVDETGNIDEKPDVMNKSNKDIVFAEDSKSSKSGFDDFGLEEKKTKTDEDIVETSSGTILGNTGPEYRIFGET